jgi:hypothetical protein
VSLDTQQSGIVAADHSDESQPPLESQQSIIPADDREDEDTIDYKSPVSTPPPPSVDPLFPLEDGHVIGNISSFIHVATL